MSGLSFEDAGGEDRFAELPDAVVTKIMFAATLEEPTSVSWKVRRAFVGGEAAAGTMSRLAAAAPGHPGVASGP